MQKPIFLKIAAPKKRNVQCVAFTATAALVAAMLAAGIQVRRHPVEPWQYVAPTEQIGEARFWELLQDSRFKYIAVVTFLVSPTGSNQTFNIPGNWNSGNNKIETIGSGGSGGAFFAGQACASGGSGAAYAAITNLVLIPGGTAIYQIAATAAAISFTNSAGNNGGNTWFNGATFGTSSVGAVGGIGGQSSSVNVSGVAGGDAASCIGTIKKSGGASGGTSIGGSQQGASGGGGAAGPNGNGNASPTSLAGNAASCDGGSGDAGSGGAAGSGAINGNGGPGGNGTEYDASHGAGGGGGGVESNISSFAGGNGGLYGGGGGASAGSNGSSGTGAQGLTVVTNVPATRAQLMSAVIS